MFTDPLQVTTMADILTKEQRHRCMARIRSKDTKPEILLRKALWRRGFRYKLNDDKLPGHPDIVLPKYRTVVFVHGCFWHGHKGCKKHVIPASNAEFWSAKINHNKNHDQEVWRQLEAKGWSVVVVWECELAKRKIYEATDKVTSEIKENGLKFQHYVSGRKTSQKKFHQAEKERRAKETAALSEITAMFGKK